MLASAQAALANSAPVAGATADEFNALALAKD